MAVRPAARVKAYWPALWILCALTILHVLIPPLAFTGDEPRYASRGVALYTAGRLVPALPAWQAFLERSHLSLRDFPYAATQEAAPSLGPSVVFGPALRVRGLGAARWAAFAIGCTGIVALYGALLAESEGRRKRAAALALAFSCLSLPVVAYLRLLYPEILLFTAIACALYTLKRNWPYPTALFAGLLPFIHVRALPLSAVLLAIVVWDRVRRNESRNGVAGSVACYVAAIALYFAIQRAAFGSLLGPAFSTYAPSLWSLPTRAGMQLFDVRHGLLAYSPIFAVGLAGLLAGALARNRFCTYSAILLAAYFATFVWSTASESFTARFWVAAIPFLAVGMSYWFGQVSQRTQWFAIAPCAAVTVVNFALFCRQPAWFLENRRASVSYAQWFAISHLHFGLFLPIDGTPADLPQFASPIPVLMTFAFAVATLLTLTIALNPKRWRTLCAAAAFTLTLVPFVPAAQLPLAPSEYRVTALADDGLAIDLLRANVNASAVQLDAKLALPWTPADAPLEFAVHCSAPGGEISASTEPSRPIVLFPGCGAATRIRIDSVPRGSGKALFAHLGAVTVMRPLL